MTHVRAASRQNAVRALKIKREHFKNRRGNLKTFYRIVGRNNNPQTYYVQVHVYTGNGANKVLRGAIMTR